MIRKFFIFIISVFFTSAPLCAWVFLDDVENQAKGKDIVPFFAYNLVNGGKARACVDFIQTYYEESTPEKIAEIKRELAAKGKRAPASPRYYREVKKAQAKPALVRAQYYNATTLIADAYNAHLTNAVNTITKSGRSSEFYDTLNLLIAYKKPADLITFVNTPDKYGNSKNCAQYGYDNKYIDLRLMFEVNDELKTLLNANAAGTASNAERKSIDIYYIPECVNDKENCLVNLIDDERYAATLRANPSLRSVLSQYDFKHTITHELGHSLGLGDQYPLSSAQKNALSKSYTLEGIEDLNSIKSILNDAPNLTCDDAEGLINLMDFYDNKSKSERKVYGWASLCEGRNVMYLNSVAVKITPQEHAAQLKFAASGYSGAEPAHLKRVRQEVQSVLTKDARAAAQIQEDIARREQEHQAAVDSVPVCPVCGEKVYEGSLVPPPNLPGTPKGKKNPNPAYKCSLQMHRACYTKFKNKYWAPGMQQAQRIKAWNAMCDKQKASK